MEKVKKTNTKFIPFKNLAKKMGKILLWTVPMAPLAGISGYVLTDIIVDKYHMDRTKNLVLIENGAHLKGGICNIVYTQEFVDDMTKSENFDIGMPIKAMKKAFEKLNSINTGIKFKLYTLADGLTKYGIEKKAKLEKSDVPIYCLHDETNSVLGMMDYSKCDFWSREIQGGKLYFKKEALYSVFNVFDNIEKTLEETNSLAYPVTLHETMHLMGFAHQDTIDSIMFPYTSFATAHDLKPMDIDMLLEYNQINYGSALKNVEIPELELLK